MAPARSRLARVSARSRDHLIALDGCLAAVLIIGSVIAVSRLHFSAPMPVAMGLAVLCTSSVAYRRVAPVLALVVATSATPAYQALTGDPSGAFVVAAGVLNAYLLGRGVVHLPRGRRQLPALGYACALTVVTAQVSGAPPPGAIVTAAVLVIVPAALGMWAGRRQSLLVRLAATTEQLAAQRPGSASRAATEERNRIARELHDVVAHNVTVMVIQAGAARVIATSNPNAARDALQIVVAAGSDALGDLRRIMGVLHGAEATPREPSGLGALNPLLERAADAGVSAELHLEGDVARLPEAQELVVYRVVQESLTNVAKHAGPTRARVDLSVGADTIEVRVSNDRGTAPPPGPTLPGGHGLLGMRERVTACGGQLRTSRHADGGFEVFARIPLAAAGDARPAVPTYPSPRRRRASIKSIRWSSWPAALAWLVGLELSVADTVHSPQRPLAAALVAAVALLVGVRRRAPLLFLLTVGCLAVSYAFVVHPLATQSLVGDFMVTVVPYTVARHEDRLRAVSGQGVWCVGAATFAFASHQGAGTAAGAIVMGTLVWTVGRVWRSYAQLGATLEERRSLLAEELDDRARLAIVGERSRIARELHYTVAQEVVAMVVQARAAQNPTTTVSASHTPLAQTAEALEATGRNALLRMRQILGVLRAPGDPIACDPAPGIEQLPDLVHHLRQTGRQVSLRVEGEPTPLAAGIDTAVYHIVEESLSAANRQLPTGILLRFAEDHLALSFTGGPAGSPAPARAVRRWVEMFDGVIETDPGAGPAITVRLPLADRAVLV